MKNAKECWYFRLRQCSTDRTAEVASATGVAVISGSEKRLKLCQEWLTWSTLMYSWCVMAIALMIWVRTDHKSCKMNIDMIMGRAGCSWTKNMACWPHFWNRLFTTALNLFFGGKLTDVLSLSRFLWTFAKSMPIFKRLRQRLRWLYMVSIGLAVTNFQPIILSASGINKQAEYIQRWLAHRKTLLRLSWFLTFTISVWLHSFNSLQQYFCLFYLAKLQWDRPRWKVLPLYVCWACNYISFDMYVRNNFRRHIASEHQQQEACLPQCWTRR